MQMGNNEVLDKYNHNKYLKFMYSSFWDTKISKKYLQTYSVYYDKNILFLGVRLRRFTSILVQCFYISSFTFTIMVEIKNKRTTRSEDTILGIVSLY